MPKSDQSPPVPINVRRAAPADVDRIVEFNLGIALETENRQLDGSVLRDGVSRLIRDSSLGFYTVAEIDGVVAGCTLITYEWSDWRNGLIWWIQSVYVAKEARGRGVFSAIHRKLDEEARATPGVIGFRLYVDQENHRAQEVYRRRGMERTNYLVFEGLRTRS